MQNFAASQDQNPCAGGRLFGWPLLAIALAAFAVVAPFFRLGIPSGHDFEFHLHSWMEVISQWRQGISYPRWAGLAHFGYGEARFIFYPPASWILGAILGQILPWGLVPGTYIWLSLVLSGCSMFTLARRWLGRQDAIFAAVLFTANPYYIVVVYWRSAFAELLAGALIPLAFLYLLELAETRNAWLKLAIVIAAGELTNAPAALMINFSVAVVALVLAWEHRSWKIMLWAALAGVVGTALGAFYVLPAWYEQSWVNMGQVLSPGVRPQDNFLFTKIADADHNRFNLLVSIVAVAEFAVLALAALFAFRNRLRMQREWLPLIFWTGVCAFLMSSASNVFWTHLPDLRFVQLPWRWLICLNVCFALFVVLAWKSWLARAAVVLAMLSVLMFVWHRIQPPWWDHTADILEMREQQRSGTGYDGTDEYVPVAADPYDIDVNAPKLKLSAAGTFKIERWEAERKSFTTNATQPETITVRLFNYPAWIVRVNGVRSETKTKEDTGELLIPLSAGSNQIEVTFARTRDRTLGAVISLVAAAAFVLLIVKNR
jgi:hypothetical protein